MIKFFGNKNTKAFGLDISDTSIKVMQLKKDSGQILPVAHSEMAISDKIMVNHLIVSPEKLAVNIKQAINLAKNIDTKYVVCSIPEIKSFVRVLSVPKMPDSEIDGSIPYELEQDIPVPVDQVYLDWQILRELPDKLELLVVATPKDYVDSLIETLHQIALKPVALELESQATARALIGKTIDKPTLIADLSTLQTSFIIVDKQSIQYTSSIPIAGNAFTESIARNLGIPKQAAEKMKREVGLTSEAKQNNIRAAILPILDNIVDEIKNVVKFFEEHDAAHRRVESVLLCGGSAELMGIADYIATRINLSNANPIDVSLGNPWTNILSSGVSAPDDFKGRELGYATVAGLALRGLDNETN